VIYSYAVIIKFYYRIIAVIIYNQIDWPLFTLDAELITKIVGQMEALGYCIQQETMLKALKMASLCIIKLLQFQI
jgi:hypothetical protein